MHDCHWTRTKRAELTLNEGSLCGAGVPGVTLERVAHHLGTTFVTIASLEDEYGEYITFEGVTRGSTHDDCFFDLNPVSFELRRAVLLSVLEQQAMYLGANSDFSEVAPRLHESFGVGTTLHFCSVPKQTCIRTKVCNAHAPLLARVWPPEIVIDCSNGVAKIR